MGDLRTTGGALLAAAVLAAALLLPNAGEAAAQKKQPAGRTTGAAQQARAESTAAVRADSLRRAAATRDSARTADSLAAHRLQPKTRVLRRLQQDAFGVGERLVFDVNYGYITAGEAVMHVAAIDSVAGRRCYRVEFSVNSLPSFSWIYEVKDQEPGKFIVLEYNKGKD